MTLMTTAFSLGAALAASLLLAAPAAAQEKPDLTGRYKIVSGEKEGVAEPQANIEDNVVEITRDRIVVTDKDKKETYSASYTIDATEKPWRITMVSRRAPEENVEAKGLIRQDGEKLMLIYALPNGETPTGFKTGPKQLMFVMQKAEAAAAR